MLNEFLITKDAKGKIRCINIDYCKEGDGYIIHRTSWQYQGKRIEQPDIVVTEGKVKRDTEAQCILQFNALVRGYEDKGYKHVDRDPDTYTLKQLEEILPEYNTDANGFRKHMLAKQADKVKESTINKVKYWYASRKIDGLRCSFYWDGNTLQRMKSLLNILKIILIMY